MAAQRASRWARVHFRLAESLESWGWLTGAGRAYRDALLADPGFAEAHFRLGEVLVRQRRWSEAGQALREAVLLHPFSMEAHGNLVLALFKHGSLPEATRVVERMIDLRPNTAELHLIRGALLRRRRLHGEAIRAFRFAATLFPDPRAAQFTLGAELLGAREWATLSESHRDARAAHGAIAAAACRASVSRAPKRNLRVRERARSPRSTQASHAQRSPVAALAALYHVVSGKTRVLLGRPHEAIRAFRQAHDALYERRDARDGTMRRCTRAIAVFAIVAPSLGLAETTSIQQQPHEAFYACVSSRREKGVAACRAALEMKLGAERKAVAQQVLAWNLANLARWDEAVEACRELVRIRPEDAEAHLRLGEALLFGVGKADEALLSLENAARINPQNARIYGARGFALASLDRFRESVEAFEHAERLDQNFWTGRPSARAVFEAARRGERWPQAENGE